jgi:hypothetical protein
VRRTACWRAGLTRTVIAIAVVLLAAASTTLLHAQPSPLERKLKAAFVSKFPQFVEWPQTAATAPGHIEVCVALPDPFGPDLDALVSGQSFGGRQLVARRVGSESDLNGCGVLYLGVRPGRRAHPLLRRAAALPILTVGDDPEFLDDGGIVRLRVLDGRVRFDINAAAARKVGLRISSQLLQLAASVRGGA